MAQTQQQEAASIKAQVWIWLKRPCLVLGEAVQERPRIGGKWRGTYTVLRLRFIDGQEPRLGQCGKVSWGKQAHVLKGAQADFWRRVDDLIEGDGMAPARAQQQAMAEQSKGIGRNPE